MMVQRRRDKRGRVSGSHFQSPEDRKVQLCPLIFLPCFFMFVGSTETIEEIYHPTSSIGISLARILFDYHGQSGCLIWRTDTTWISA